MHTHFTRLPHQRVPKKVPPPPLLGRWLLMLGVLLMTWGFVPQVVRANTDPKDVAKTICIDNIALSEARPYIEFRYMDYDKDNSKPDAMRRIRIYANEFVEYRTISPLIKNFPVYNDILVGEMPRCHDKLVRHNEAYGRLTIVKDVMNGKKRTVYARFYPSKKLLEGEGTPDGKGKLRGIRFVGCWDNNDNGDDPDNIDVYLNFTAGSAINESQTNKGSFVRSAAGKITFNASKLPNKKAWGFAPTYYFNNSRSYTSLKYGSVYAADNATSVSKTLDGTFSNRNAVTIYYWGAWSAVMNIGVGSVVDPIHDNKNSVFQRYNNGTIWSVTVPGCPYPGNLSAEPKQWTKTVKLTWNTKGDTRLSSEKDKWLVYRYKQGESASSAKRIAAVDYNTNNCEVEVPSLETEYVYIVTYQKDGWKEGIVDDLKATVTTKIVPSFVFDKVDTRSEEQSVVVTWNYGAFRNSEQSFLVYSRLAGTTQWSNPVSVPRTDVNATSGEYEYTGIKNVCDSYEFKVALKAFGKTFESPIAVGSISGSSRVTSLNVSKGLYSNSVKLTWNAQQISEGNTRYVVARRMLGSKGNWSDIHTVSGTSEMYTFDDNNVAPGQYYEYRVSSYINCNNNSTQTAEATDNGFCQATGTIAGRIAYGTGTAVEGVRVNLVQPKDGAEAKSQFYSLRVDNVGGGLVLPLNLDEAGALFMDSVPLTMQAWFRLDDNIKESGNAAKYAKPMLIDTYDNFSLFGQRTSSGAYQLTLRLPTPDKYADTPTTVVLEPNNYYAIALSTDGAANWTLRAIDTKGKMQKFETKATGMPKENRKKLYNLAFGTNVSDLASYNFNGYIDEVRVWNKALTDAELTATYDHQLSGDEKDLYLYWPLDEGITNQTTAYDYSKTGGVANGHHGTIKSSNKISTIVPPDDAFSIYGRTDAEGNYVIKGVPFTGSGTNYSVVPSKGVHSFTPQKLSRYVSQNSINHNGVDFEDTSSFPVTGQVLYEGTTYPVEGCNFYVDGNICYKDGEPITSDSEGRFSISVPIGDHFIQIKKQGHEFASAGRFPADDKGVGTRYTFVEKDAVNFTDVTKVVIAGRVAGGDVEKGKPLGLAQSKANIGQAVIKLSAGDAYRMNVVRKDNDGAYTYENATDARSYEAASKQVKSTAQVGGGDDDAVKTITITTDPATGEFAALVPPVQYKVTSVEVPSNAEIVFDRATIPGIDASNPLAVKTDSVTTDKGIVQRFSYVASLNLAHRVEPTFDVKQKGAPAFGDATFKYVTLSDPKGQEVPLYTTDEQGTVTYAMGAPVFTQLRRYTFTLDGYEQYVNQDDAQNPVTDRVPLQKSTVTITNQFAAGQVVNFEGADDGKFKDENNLATNQLQLDSLGHAEYTFMAGFPNITEPYTLGLNMVFDVNGAQKQWSGNGTFKAIVLGELPSGNNFVTSGPDKVLMVLRDPPGSNSNAYYETSTSVTESTSYAGSFVTNNEVSTLTKLGFQAATWVGVGAGVITEASTKADLEVGAEVNLDITDSQASSTTTTTTNRVSTSDEEDYVGANGDVFIGTATNILFGNARSVDIRPDGKGGFGVTRENVISTGMEFGTGFNYSQNYVENTLLPNLESVRNSLLHDPSEGITSNTTNEVVYVSKVSKDDPRFGSNNNDKDVWGAAAVSGDKLDGPSYTMMLPAKTTDSNGKPIAFEDKVKWYNSQMALWTQTLANNEKAKIEAKSSRTEYLISNYSFDAGATVENSVGTIEAKSHETSEEFEVMIVGGVTTGFEINGTGVDLTVKTTTGTRNTFVQGSSSENAKTIGYTLKENGDDDALSVDVFNAPDGFGPIFITRGGQTCCPYEDKYVSKYYEPGTEISAATMQIEVPKLNVENNYATDVPSGGTANFTLLMQNDSETGEDVWFQLSMLDETNPNGAKLSIDGQALTDGRVFLVPAGNTLRKQLQLTQTDQSVLEYNNIKLALRSQCQSDPTGSFPVIADTVAISAQFVPSCSDIMLSVPDRVVNCNTGSQLKMVVSRYDRNFRSFKGFRIQYKGARDVDWQLAKEFVNNEADLTDNNQLISGASTTYVLDMGNNALFPDQTYELRAITMCDFGSGEVNNESETIEVVKDVARPKLLGNPSPANGVLTPDGEVSITFNEDIKASSLIRTENFVVTSKLNGSKVDHDVALQLTGAEGAQTEADIDLAARPFALNMWLNYTGAGQILSHGAAATKFTLSVDDEGHLTADVAGTKVTSEGTLPKDKWTYLALSYAPAGQGGTLTADCAYDDTDASLFASQPVPAYNGNGPLRIGGGMKGAMQELTLWNAARSYAEAKADMYTTKQANTADIAGYWPLNEGTGTTANDVARSRHITLPAASWYMATPNKAVSLNGTTDYAAIDLTSCSPATDEDYALELWFKGSKPEAGKQATLFSTHADGVMAAFNAQGQLQLSQNDQMLATGTADCLDNQWHHFALNVLHDGTAAVYVDGNNVAQFTPSAPLRLQSDSLMLGVMRRAQTAGAADFVYSNYFNGQLDELRLWNARLTADVLRAARLQRLEGTESGLVAYYPFEKIQLNQYSQAEVVADMADHATTTLPKPHEAKLYGSAAIGDEAPGLKAAPKLSNVAFNFTASERKVVITLNESAAALEGCTVNFTLRGIRDVNNNLADPISWTAYVQQNQLLWGDSQLTLAKQQADKLTTEVEIVNNSSAAEAWTISGLPSWLTLNTESGQLKPLGTAKLRLTVPASVAAGRYEATLYLTGNLGVAQPLHVQLTVTGQQPDWRVDAAKYDMNMSMVAQLQFNGVPSENGADLVAAFNAKGTCVGVASPVYNKRYDCYFAMLTIYGNSDEPGSPVSFKAWHAATGKVHPVVATADKVTFSANAVYGSVTKPYVLNATNAVEQQFSLHQGWQWLSFSVTPVDATVAGTFAPVAATARMLKNQTQFAVPAADSLAWTGGLDKLNVKEMYMLYMEQPADFSVKGEQVNTATTPVTLNKGWTWLGYTPTYAASPLYALAPAAPVTGDIVKGQNGFAMYQDYEWIGSLEVMEPGQGYIYFSAADDSRQFGYPTAAPASKARRKVANDGEVYGGNAANSDEVQSAFPPVDRHAYPNNMTVIARITQGGQPVSGAEIGVFADDECRGTSVEIDGLYFITISGDGNGPQLDVRVAHNGQVRSTNAALTYVDNAMIGTLNEPFAIELLTATGVTDAEAPQVNIMPRRVKTHVTASTNGPAMRLITIHATNGQLLYINQNPAPDTERIDMSRYAEGVYYITVQTADGKSHTAKLMK